MAVATIASYLRRRPLLKVIIFSGDDTVARCRQCLMEGAAGFVSKLAAVQDLPAAVDTVWAGERFVSESITPLGVPIAKGLEQLKPASLRVLRELRQGRTHAEISAELNITRKTVEYHVRRIKGALGLARGRTDWKAL